MRVFCSCIFVLYYSINIIQIYNILKFNDLKISINFRALNYLQQSLKMKNSKQEIRHKCTVIDDTIESFTKWLKEVNNFDDRKYKELAKNKTDKEIADMLINGEISDNDILPYLSFDRVKSVCDILEQVGYFA